MNWDCLCETFEFFIVWFGGFAEDKDAVNELMWVDDNLVVNYSLLGFNVMKFVFVSVEIRICFV